MRVLVAEDDAVLAKAVAIGLRREGMAVDIALDGNDALTHIGVNQYDVVVLDRDLPANAPSYQRFQRLDGRRAQHKGGHGLGLSIVQAIATAHGAAISASALPMGGLSLDVIFPPPAHSDHDAYETVNA